MTKFVTTILTIFIFLTAFGQTNNSMVNFKHTFFGLDGKASKTKEISLRLDGFIDFEFYKKNFNKTYLYPKPFINEKYKNQSIEIWNDPSKTKDINTNWAYTYIYDSISRVTDYNYSACLICSQLPFRIQISYDQKNRPVKFQVRHSFEKKETADEDYVFSYDDIGNIVRVQFYRLGKLEEEIEKI